MSSPLTVLGRLTGTKVAHPLRYASQLTHSQSVDPQEGKMSEHVHHDRHDEKHARTWGQSWSLLAGIVLVLNLLALLVLGVGLALGWFGFSVNNEQPGQMRVVFALNTSKVAESVEEGIEQTQDASESVVAVAQQETVRGKVSEISPTEDKMTVASEDEGEIVVTWNDVTEVEIDGKPSQMQRIAQGDPVRVIFRTKDGENFALKVVLMPESS